MHGEVISKFPEPAHATPGTPCRGLRIDRDFKAGLRVSVVAGDREVGSASLTAGRWRPYTGNNKGVCRFWFVASDLPRRNCYGVGVGNRPTIAATLSQVRAGVIDVSSDTIGSAPCDYTM